MRVNEYKLIEELIERGTRYGITRSFKHLDEGQFPTEEHLVENILNGVMVEISEYFIFDEEVEL